MDWLNYKRRISRDYKFSTNDRNSVALKDLRDMIKGQNKHVRSIFKRYKEFYNEPHAFAPNEYGSQSWDTPDHFRLQRVRVCPRGQGHTFTNWIGLDNADYFDIYIGNI